MVASLLSECLLHSTVVNVNIVFVSPLYKWNFCDPKELPNKENGGVAVLTETKVSNSSSIFLFNNIFK